ncbi:MAG: hypothetical protein F9K22_12395 [Bacteroidetes bacterium]|nr:MAG: hypothetical protein F9K22_12395 [Bacteroidota bacterium]
MRSSLIAAIISLFLIVSCKDTINAPEAQVITVNSSTSRIDTVYLFVKPSDTLKIESQILYHPSGIAYTNITVTNMSNITLDTAGVLVKKYVQKPTNSGIYDSLTSTYKYLAVSLKSGENMRINTVIQYSSGEIGRIEAYIRMNK